MGIKTSRYILSGQITASCPADSRPGAVAGPDAGPTDHRTLEAHRMAARFSLEQYGIGVEEVHRNLPPAVLYEHALKWDRGSAITASGALVAMSGVKTGRSPTDKRIIDDPNVAEDVWWGK